MRQLQGREEVCAVHVEHRRQRQIMLYEVARTGEDSYPVIKVEFWSACLIRELGNLCSQKLWKISNDDDGRIYSENTELAGSAKGRET
jgi:hypothetical protein